MTDVELLAHSLLIWANHIETGNVTLSANDVLGMGKNAPNGAKVNQLNEGQRDLVKRLRDLNKAVLKDGSVTNVQVDSERRGYAAGQEKARSIPGGGLFGRR